MINTSRFTKILVAILLIFVTKQKTYAQNSKNKFPEFLEYKSWGYTVNPVLYKAPQYIKTTGNVPVQGNAIPSVNFGFDKIIHPDNELSFRYGIHLNLLPLYSVNYNLPDNDFPGSVSNSDFNQKGYGHLVFSVPLEVELKKQMGARLYFSARAGINIMVLSQGSVEVGSSVFVDSTNEIREVFELRSITRKFPLYPNIKISPGFYYMTEPILYQISLIYQKAIPNYFTGEYLFDNLDVSRRTEGDYKLSGDHIGLGVTLFFKKRKPRKKKKKEKNVKNVFIN